jgi:WD40 repeat protein
LQGPSSEITDVAITPDGRTVVSSARDGTLKIWTLEAQQVPLEGHDEAITGIAVTPDGEKIVSSSWDFTLGVWDLPNTSSFGSLGTSVW